MKIVAMIVRTFMTSFIRLLIMFMWMSRMDGGDPPYRAAGRMWVGVGMQVRPEVICGGRLLHLISSGLMLMLRR